MKKLIILLFSSLACIALADDLSDPIYCYGPGATIPGIYYYRSRGTARDKEVVGSGDTITGLYGNAYKGTTGFTPAATPRVSIQFQTAEAWSATANGTKIIFNTTPLTTAIPATALTIAGSEVTVNVPRFTLPSDAAPKTNVTPTSVGQLIYNSADNQLCV